MVLRTLMALVAVMAGSCVMAGVCWFTVGEGAEQVRTWWRVRQQKKAEQRVSRFEREWNPRGQAWRRFKEARVDTMGDPRAISTAPTISINRGPVQVTVRAKAMGSDPRFGG